MRLAWFAGLIHAVGGAAMLLATGTPVVLAPQSVTLGLLSAAAVVVLAYGVKHGSRIMAALLFLGVFSPAAAKLFLMDGYVDWPAFGLSVVYGLGLIGTLELHRQRVAA